MSSQNVEHLCQPTPAYYQAGYTYLHTTSCPRSAKKKAGKKRANERGKITSPNMPTLGAGSGGQGTLTFRLPH